MKLLENAKLDGISAALCMDMGDCKISGRWGYASIYPLM